MTYRIQSVRRTCRMLNQIGAEFERTQPFAGTDHRHRHPPRAEDRGAPADAQGGGARGRLDRQPQLDPARAPRLPARARGDRDRRPDPRSRGADRHLDEVLAAEPDLLLDNGGDLFVRYLEHAVRALIGGTEETTSGRIACCRCATRSPSRSW